MRKECGSAQRIGVKSGRKRRKVGMRRSLAAPDAKSTVGAGRDEYGLQMSRRHGDDENTFGALSPVCLQVLNAPRRSRISGCGDAHVRERPDADRGVVRCGNENVGRNRRERGDPVEVGSEGAQARACSTHMQTSQLVVAALLYSSKSPHRRSARKRRSSGPRCPRASASWRDRRRAS